MSEPSLGQLPAGMKQAVQSLQTLARDSRGALTVDLESSHVSYGVLWIRVWLASHSLPSSDQGITLDEWEPIDLQITADFPYKAPIASGRASLPTLPHQPEGAGFCVHVPTHDWNPSAGMNGFFKAVITAYGRISLGTLEGNLQPWQPLEHYFSPGCVVIKKDLESATPENKPILRWAIGVQPHKNRIDIVDWLDYSADDSLDSMIQSLRGELARVRETRPNAFLVPAAVFAKIIPFEYSPTLSALLTQFKFEGIEVDESLDRILSSLEVNNPDVNHENQANDVPCLVLSRSPADTQPTSSPGPGRFAAARMKRQDVADAIAMPDAKGAATAEARDPGISWVEVHDGRPDVVRRRATGRPVAGLAGRRVLVLGCGGLGAPIAEHCVRAGAALVHMADSDQVTPGILTRQPYEDADIGKPKAEVLAHRLGRIYAGTQTTFTEGDILKSDILEPDTLDQYDLVIDATANRSVALKIERLRRYGADRWPHLISVGISQHASHGIAAVSPRGRIGAGVDLLRRMGLTCCRYPELADVFSAFFPGRATRINFRPDPAPAEPTFVGSSTDVSAPAALLLDCGLIQLKLSLGPDSASTEATDASEDAGSDGRSLSIVRLGADHDSKPGRIVLSCPDDHVVQAGANPYQIRLSGSAKRQIYVHIKASVEEGADAGAGLTGGLLLGEVDDACGVAWVSHATCLPPGGTIEPLDMNLGERVVRRVLDRHRQQSSGMVSLIGFWKTQRGIAGASEDDGRAVQEIVNTPQSPPRMLLLLVDRPEDGSADQASGSWAPSMSAEVFPPDQISPA